MEEDGQLLRATQIEQDHFEMQVRAANIVSHIYVGPWALDGLVPDTGNFNLKGEGEREEGFC